MFLDEPTANLDPVGRRMVRDALLGLRGQGVTVFLSSHMLSEVEMTCTRVAIMDAGRIVRVGTVEELTQKVASIAGRKSEFSQMVNFKSDSLVLSLYDNGEIDGDTVSVIMNGETIMAKASWGPSG